MEVNLTPELQERLSRLAAETGFAVEVLAQQAIERYVHHDQWFLDGVQEGIDEADEGKLITHEDIAILIHSRYPG